jgi:drug/metabolite transporter (DMT)-like permease
VGGVKRPDRSKRHLSRAALPYLLLTLAPLCWAGNVVLARGVAPLIPPVCFAFWRWTLASLVLLPFTWQQVKRDWPVARQGWKMIALLSVLGISCFNTLLYTAVHTTTAINGALIQSTMPAIIILFSLVIYRERISTIQSAGVTLCVLGAGWIVLRGDLQTLVTMSFVRGDILVVIAVVLYALYSTLLRQRPALHPLSFLSLTFVMGALGLLPLYVWESFHYPPPEVTAEVVASILYVALLPSIVAYFCWNHGIELIGANRAGLFINLVPVFASGLAIVMLGESLHSFHMLGMLLIFSGMILFNRDKEK